MRSKGVENMDAVLRLPGDDYSTSEVARAQLASGSPEMARKANGASSGISAAIGSSGADAAHRAQDDFLATLAHELRNPLTPIAAALKLMALKDDTVFIYERGVITRQLANLSRLVDDMLDVVRASREGTQICYERCAIRSVLTHAAEITHHLMQLRRHKVSMTLPSDEIHCNGDPGRLVQVFSNLLTNAARYTPDGGRIEIRATIDGAACQIAVIDNGQGIAADVLPHLFDLYFQGIQVPEQARVGFGIGLNLVKDLVNRHGGSVSAHSQGVGRGSEFVVRLPLARALRSTNNYTTVTHESSHE